MVVCARLVTSLGSAVDGFHDSEYIFWRLARQACGGDPSSADTKYRYQPLRYIKASSHFSYGLVATRGYYAIERVKKQCYTVHMLIMHKLENQITNYSESSFGTQNYQYLADNR